MENQRELRITVDDELDEPTTSLLEDPSLTDKINRYQ